MAGNPTAVSVVVHKNCLQVISPSLIISFFMSAKWGFGIILRVKKVLKLFNARQTLPAPHQHHGYDCD